MTKLITNTKFRLLTHEDGSLWAKILDRASGALVAEGEPILDEHGNPCGELETTMTETTTTTIQTLYDAATGAWTGADWAHELIRGQRAVQVGGRTAYCTGESDCERCFGAMDDAEQAESLAWHAMDLLAVPASVAAAQMFAAEAVSLERRYGSAPVWGQWAQAVAALEERIIPDFDDLLDPE